MATALPEAPSSITLDADQTKAAAHATGTAAVAAAAGSGKTTLLVGRAIRLVESGVDPTTVMTLAFNRNAAETLRERFRNNPATQQAAAGMASTFHAFAFGMCRLVQPTLRVLGQNAQDEAARNHQRNEAPRRTARDIGREVWVSMGGYERGAARPAFLEGVELDKLIEVEPGVRERLFSAGWPNVPGGAQGVAAAIDALKGAFGVPSLALAEFMLRSREARRKDGAVDFTDMLLGFGNYLRREEPRVMTRFRQFQHLQVDEAQDGNELRWYIAQTFANFGGGRSVVAVGDLRQSIAGFAGAQPKLFKAWWDKADAQFTLPRNYRSAKAIVEAGNAVADGEPWNIGGDSIAARDDLGKGRVRVGPVGSLSIAVEIASAIKNGEYGPKDVTVLSRTRAALETVAFGLRAKGLRVVVRGGGNVWRSMDGRMVRAYLDLAQRKVRDQRAAVMALNRPLRYVSGAKLATWVDGNGAITAALWREAERYRPAMAVIDVIETLESLQWEERVAQVREWLAESLAQDAEGDQSAPGRDSDKAELYANLCEIARVCGSVENLDIAIEAEGKVDPKDEDVVELSTIHQSKGDQWGTVYVTIAPGVFPSPRASTGEELAEETRLLYVAVTRPVHTLVVDVQGGGFGDKVRALARIAESTSPRAAAPDTLPADEAKVQPIDVSHVTPGCDDGSCTPAALTDAKGFVEGLQSDEERAKRLSAAGVQPRAGERFVPVLWRELVELLAPHGFVEDFDRAGRAGQRVLTARLIDGAQVSVFTTVPPGNELARGNGDDSIKVALLDAANKPIARKQPYAARTRNWRVTLLSRLVEIMQAHPSIS